MYGRCSVITGDMDDMRDRGAARQCVLLVFGSLEASWPSNSAEPCRLTSSFVADDMNGIVAGSLVAGKLSPPRQATDGVTGTVC